MASFPIGSETSNIEFWNSFPTNEAKDNRIGENNFITTILADDPWRSLCSLQSPAGSFWAEHSNTFFTLNIHGVLPGSHINAQL